MTNKAASSGSSNKISTFVLAVTYITLILSIIAIVAGVTAFYEGFIEVTAYLLAIGFIALALSGYYVFQSRKHVATLKIETPKILTTIECIKCGIKSTREFQRGDYVYKELDKCSKCEDTQVITAIYREPTLKEKEKNPTA
ncbi:MAG: hypothetical protein NWF05_02510 [Candidatus Bathyarchaeota archaeon]|nr:hypothetical protein [Candidatus Bathyarchaeota archaeon]